MRVFVALCLLFACAHAGLVPASTTLLRTPSLDSAIIKSDRIGGNFAYSSIENHAYTALTPVISYSTHQIPFGITQHQHTLISHQQPFLTQHLFTNPLLSGVISQNPIFGQYPIYGQQPIVAQDPSVVQSPVFGQGPILGQQPISQDPSVIQSPILGQQPIAQDPSVIQSPIFGQGPIFGQQPGVIGGAPGAPIAPQADPAPTPVQGSVIDEDTVAVDSA